MKPFTALILFLMVTSCVTQKVNQFSSFASAGVTYTDALDKLTREAVKIAIDTDSEILLKNRDQLTENERASTYSQQTKALQELLSTISAFRVHTALLNRYFTMLGQLAAANSPATLPDHLSVIVASLKSIHPSLENVSLGSSSVKDLMKTASPLLVSAFKKQAMEDELKLNAATIERELELQCAFLKALSEQMKSDLLFLIKLKDFQNVSLPYITSLGPMDVWKEKRKETLTSIVSFDAIDRAASAAEALKNSFLNLTCNSSQTTDFSLLFGDLNSVLDLVEMIQKNFGNH